MDVWPPLQSFLLSLAIGLMLGLERERRPQSRAGLRSFALVALLGSCGALLAGHYGSPWPLVAGLLLVGALMLRLHPLGPEVSDPDSVTPLAALLCYCLGALAWSGQHQLAVALALGTFSLMHFKAELHGFSRRLSRQDLQSFLQFALIAFIVLPLLPDRGYGPYGALNPHRMWLMVVLVSGIGLAAYVAARLVGTARGAPLLGVLGGAVSSTATTLVYARQVRQRPESLPLALAVILIANLTVSLRLALIAAVMDHALLPALALPLGLGLLFGGLAAAWAWRRVVRDQPPSELAVENPVSLRAALAFGLLFGAVLLAAARLHAQAGTGGVYGVALVSGLTDVDVITLSAIEMHGAGSLQPSEVARAVGLACLANLVSKATLAGLVAGRRLLRPLLAGFLAIAAGLVLGLLLL